MSDIKKSTVIVKAKNPIPEVQIYNCQDCHQQFRTRIKPNPLRCKDCRIKLGENPYAN
jgi:ribosomal protein L37AE/L43A